MYKKALEMCDKVGTLGYRAMTAWCWLRYTPPATSLHYCYQALLSAWCRFADLNSWAVWHSAVSPCARTPADQVAQLAQANAADFGLGGVF